MKKSFIILSFLGCLTFINAQTKKRADFFFGIHFDFHASASDSEIGKTFTAEMIDSFLTIVKPDFVQVDCKGYAGYSRFPTKVGNRAGVNPKDLQVLSPAEELKKFRDTIISFMRKQENDFIKPTFGNNQRISGKYPVTYRRKIYRTK